ncbi:hypothetical protein A2164_00945, partial [Candidatus Curtissbacteria bacterium RBG_13_35_7]
DQKNFGKSDWNPLSFLIRPGMKVVIKPNFVLSKHSEGKNVYSIITHPSLIRAIVDYAWIALKGKGEIIIADSPQYNCNFAELIATTKLDEVCNFYNSQPGLHVQLINLQSYWSKGRHFPSQIIKLPGDPKGIMTVNLGKKSHLYTCPNPEKFYGAVYHRQETIEHHLKSRQEYELSKTIMEADVVISVPKLKVHKKVGVTLNIKGLVGICTNKNYIVHYRLGLPSEGGDQYPGGVLNSKELKIIKFERWMYDHFLAKRMRWAEYIHRFIYGFLYLKIVKNFDLEVPDKKRLLDAGNWYGNDSAWRMAVDLAKIIYFFDKKGKIHKQKQRRLFSVIDGIVGGENNGPLVPNPKLSGILMAGENFWATDIVATRLMGFDWRKIKMFSILNDISYNFEFRKPKNIKVISNVRKFEKCLFDKTSRFLSFKPHPGWKGHIEI